jgi:Ca-activated chloride channel homolog
MYMQRRDTTPPRNNHASAKLLVGLLLLGTVVFFSSGWAQTSQTPTGQNNPTPVPVTQGQQPLPATQGQPPAPGQKPPAANPAPSGPGQPVPVQGAGQGQASQGQGQGQEPATQDGGFVFTTEAREVVLNATVVDDKNRLVTSLTKPDFTVFENNKPQEIRHFEQKDLPVAMGIVIDNSGSMREKRDEVNKAALNLVRSSNPEDQVFVVNFNDEFYLDQDFTSDIKKLQEALEHVETRGGTALYDAITASADYLLKSKLQRKVLFVVTDGEDDASQQTLEEAVHRLQQENGPTVYAIGLLGDEKSRHAKRALETIAERTGGMSFFPPTLDQVDEISRTVAHDIRNQYVISYRPTTPRSVPGFRSIHVEARARPYKHLVVRTRAGYYPGQENATK